jgi:phage shock protein PspC (stress-responsive transcriptional regulator)
MSEARAPLRRSRSDRVLGGVCGGLGEFFGLKPLWFRIIFVILGIPGGLPGIVPYILLWLIIPEEGSE